MSSALSCARKGGSEYVIPIQSTVISVVAVIWCPLPGISRNNHTRTKFFPFLFRLRFFLAKRMNSYSTT